MMKSRVASSIALPKWLGWKLISITKV